MLNQGQETRCVINKYIREGVESVSQYNILNIYPFGELSVHHEVVYVFLGSTQL